MASIALPLLGTNPYTRAALALAGALIDNQLISLITPGQTTEQGRLSDVDYQSATLGAGLKKGYGTAKVTGNIIWGTKFTEHVTEQTQGGGKGGGGTKTTTKTYTYSASFAVVISEGPISSLVSVYADGNEFELSNLDYRLYMGTEEQLPDDFIESIEGVGNVPAFRGLAYIVFRNLSLEDYGNRIPSFSFIVNYPKNSLQAIVEDIATEAGLTLGKDFDASALSDMEVPGFTRDGTQTFKEQIDQLRLCHIFDGVEREGLVRFAPRNFDTVIPLTKNDYGAYENNPEENPVTITVPHDLSLPKVLKVNYISSDNDYQTAVATSYRQCGGANSETSVNTDVVMSDSQAKEIAEMRLYEAWISRTTYDLKLPSKYGWVLPGDILELELDNDTKQLVIVQQTNYGRPGINVVKACNVDSSVYNVVTRTVDSKPTPIIVVPSKLYYAILDIPKLPLDTNSGDDYLYLVSGAANYFGANVYTSSDNGSNYNLLLANSYNGIVGKASTVLKPAKPYSWDKANTVTVELDYGSLESRTKEDVLNYYNTAIIGDEVIQFRYADLQEDGTYVLRELLRGRLGTEEHIYNHTAGERFVMLQQTAMASVPVTSANWYTNIMFRIGPKGKNIVDSSYVDDNFTPQGNMYKPWSGCHLKVTKEGNTYSGKWIRRTRKDGSWKDYSDVPLSENSEVYSIDVIGGGGNVLETLSTSTTQFTYTSNADILGFDIYQISENKGRGWPVQWRVN